MAAEGRGRTRGESTGVTEEGRERVKSILIPLIPMLFFPLVYKHTGAGWKHRSDVLLFVVDVHVMALALRV